MRYHKLKKVHTLMYEEEVERLSDSEDVTEVMININLKKYRDGLSKDMLQHIVDSATEKLSSYRIFNTPEGLTITGRY